jgi:hypothetical protein
MGEFTHNGEKKPTLTSGKKTALKRMIARRASIIRADDGSYWCAGRRVRESTLNGMLAMKLIVPLPFDYAGRSFVLNGKSRRVRRYISKHGRSTRQPGPMPPPRSLVSDDDSAPGDATG